MSEKMQKVQEALAEIYKQAPEVPCNRCSRCCISPHMSYIELIALLRKMVEVFSEDELRLLVSAEPIVSEFHLNNIICPLLRDSECSCYEVRPLSCRLEGIDILDQLTARERICSYQQGAVTEEDFGGEEIEAILDAANKLNMPYCGLLDEPYFFDSVNLHCWFAIMFDPDITQEYFLKLRELIFAEVDLRYLGSSYVNHTRFNEKLDLIDKFFELNNEKKAQEALECIQKVNTEFPYTGAYYYPQANVYINFMRDLIAVVEKDEA